MKKITKIVAAFAASALVVLATACTSVSPVVDHAQFPGDASTYSVLGRVTVKSNTAKSGYIKLLDEAKAQYPAADDVVNVKMDRKMVWFLCFPIADNYEMTGIAIDYK